MNDLEKMMVAISGVQASLEELRKAVKRQEGGGTPVVKHTEREERLTCDELLFDGRRCGKPATYSCTRRAKGEVVPVYSCERHKSDCCKLRVDEAEQAEEKSPTPCEEERKDGSGRFDLRLDRAIDRVPHSSTGGSTRLAASASSTGAASASSTVPDRTAPASACHTRPHSSTLVHTRPHSSTGDGASGSPARERAAGSPQGGTQVPDFTKELHVVFIREGEEWLRWGTYDSRSHAQALYDQVRANGEDARLVAYYLLAHK